MEPDLEELLEIEKENNKLLKKLWRNVRVGRLMKLLYWIVILAITLGAYYYVQPYIDKFIEAYTNIKGATQNLNNLSDVNLLNQLLGK